MDSGGSGSRSRRRVLTPARLRRGGRGLDHAAWEDCLRYEEEKRLLLLLLSLVKIMKRCCEAALYIYLFGSDLFASKVNRRYEILYTN